jgi:flavodoxin
LKTLIIYLSATGNTECVAHEIAIQLGNTDLFPIQLKTKIPEREFWRILKIEFFLWLGRGMRYSIPNLDVSKYDQIIVGTPVWMGKAAIPVINVMKKLQVNNKVKGLFATCGMNPGNVFYDLSKKTNIGSISNCLSISASNLTDDISIQNEVKDFVNILKKNNCYRNSSCIV